MDSQNISSDGLVSRTSSTGDNDVQGHLGTEWLCAEFLVSFSSKSMKSCLTPRHLYDLAGISSWDLFDSQGDPQIDIALLLSPLGSSVS